MFTKGVLVVGMSDLDITGKAVNPAKMAGIKTGDIILQMNGEDVSYNEDVGRIVAESGGKDIDVTLRRGKTNRVVKLCPVSSPVDGSYKAGMWVPGFFGRYWNNHVFFNPLTGGFCGLRARGLRRRHRRCHAVRPR
jgi:stage IV sporulation protein B